MKSALFILMLLCSTSTVFSQRNVFVWGEGLTEYTGKFDTTKFTLEELNTIYRYLYNRHDEMLIKGNVWKIEQMDTVTTKYIDLYYAETLHILETMKVPSGKFWNDLLIYRKRELKEVCDHNRLFILAITNPAVMYDHYHEECADAIKALNGDSTQLLKAWYDLNESQKKRNCCPDEVEKEYQAEKHSKNCLKYARLEVMTYSWGNCMNQFVYYHSDDEHIQKEFEKLFIRVKKEEFED